MYLTEEFRGFSKIFPPFCPNLLTTHHTTRSSRGWNSCQLKQACWVTPAVLWFLFLIPVVNVLNSYSLSNIKSQVTFSPKLPGACIFQQGWGFDSILSWMLFRNKTMPRRSQPQLFLLVVLPVWKVSDSSQEATVARLQKSLQQWRVCWEADAWALLVRHRWARTFFCKHIPSVRQWRTRLLGWAYSEYCREACSTKWCRVRKQCVHWCVGWILTNHRHNMMNYGSRIWRDHFPHKSTRKLILSVGLDCTAQHCSRQLL